jgi:hypothetical protein
MQHRCARIGTVKTKRKERTSKRAGNSADNYLLTYFTTSEYLPDFSRMNRAISIRVRLDLVILADGGGQRFRHPQIQENVLPLWFDHAATHEPSVWTRHNVAGWL